MFEDVHLAFGEVVPKPGFLQLQDQVVHPHRVIVGHHPALVAKGEDPVQIGALGAHKGAAGFGRFLGKLSV